MTRNSRSEKRLDTPAIAFWKSVLEYVRNGPGLPECQIVVHPNEWAEARCHWPGCKAEVVTARVFGGTPVWFCEDHQ